MAVSLACFVWPARAADEPAAAGDYLQRRWDVDDGLPDDAVAAITQTHDGYLWIGTARGLARFDGVRFQLFTAANTPALASDHIRFLAEDNEGALWIGLNHGGIVRHRNGEFEPMASQTDIPANWPTSLVADGEGGVWAGLPNLRAARWRGGKWTEYGEVDGIAGSGAVNCIAGFHGRTWFTTETSCGFFDGTRFITLTTDVPLPQFQPRHDDGCWLARANVLRKFNERGQTLLMGAMPWNGGAAEIQTLLETRDGVLWIGTKGQGLYRLDDTGIERVPTSHPFITAIHEDREGNLWIGTWGDGVNRLRLRQIKLHDARNGLLGDEVSSICEDADGGLWFASRNAGVVRLANGRTTAFTVDHGWPGGVLATICAPPRAADLWFGTLGAGLLNGYKGRFTNEGLKGELIESLRQDSNGILWIGTAENGLFRRDNGLITREPTGNGLRAITAIEDCGGKCLWVGTRNGTLFRRRGDPWQRFDREQGLPTGAIRTILADDPDTLWIGTREGLVRFAQGQFSLLTSRHGLRDDDIRQILDDGAGNLWFGSSRGLFRATRAGLEAAVAGVSATVDCVAYGRGDGLGSFEFTEGYHNAACRARDGRLWFATKRGAVEVNPKDLIGRAGPPPVCIEEILADDRPLPLSGLVRIPPRCERLQVRYTAPSFAAPEKVRFRYRLEGAGEDWSETTRARVATFLRTPPGSYRFQVTACNAEGVWNNDGAVLDFVIQAALWQTPWFRLTVFAAVVALAAALGRFVSVRRTQRKLRALEQQHALDLERARIARDMHDHLGAGLTRVALLSEAVRQETADSPETAARAEKLSRAAREVSQSLDEIVWTVNPGNDTLERLIGYLSDYTAEYLAATGIRLSQDLPEKVPAVPLSSEARHDLLLAVKEALNNAVKHAAATEIKLGVAVEPEALRVGIADNGRGFDPAVRASGHGLSNMRGRLAAAGGGCLIESIPGKGTRVQFTLPLKRE
jgi:ligand-binding sensor domain-containing protein/signal transduction histidine kinase